MNQLHNRLFLFGWLLCGATWLSAQQPDGEGIRLTAITSQSSVKLEVSFHELPASDAIFNIRIDGADKTLLTEKAVKPAAVLKDQKKLIFYVADLNADLWSPANPALYDLYFRISRNKKTLHEKHQRIGFRFFEAKDGKLFLNNKPIFLRGIAINPPGRGIPDSIETSREFAEDYVRFMKSINVNIIRIANHETWYKVCDELGMMVFGGNYAGSVNGEKPPEDYDKGVSWYRDVKLGEIASHPSLMIYAMTNEVPYTGEIADKWEKFLSYAHKQLKNWDSTRAYIANAGYGYGKSGDICDLHRYWGWYYNSPFNFLNIRDNKLIIPFEKKVQPITFTECVGNYTGPDGRYNLTPNHKNPGSQLNWTGHADWSIQAQLANEHQSFTFKQATELFRRLRAVNPELSGVFPFTIMFFNWHTIKTFMDMDPKPVTNQARISYQPVLLSWENWTPNIYAGSEFKPIAHIINDDDHYSDLKGARVIYQLQDHAGTVVLLDSFSLPTVPYYGTFSKKLSLKIPSPLTTGTYNLVGKIVSNGRVISENHDKLFISDAGMANAGSQPSGEILLYDPEESTGPSLRQLGIAFKKINSVGSIPASSLLVIGENAANAGLAKHAAALKSFIKQGGKMLCLRQDSVSFNHMNKILDYELKNITVNLDVPAYPPPPRPSRNGYYVNPERREHPVFDGIAREQLEVWSDYTGWDESKKGFPAIYPVTDGFVPKNKMDLEHISVLANYGVALEGITLAEMFSGKGNVLLCGLDLARRTGLDPVADRMLVNLLAYMGNNQPHTQYTHITDKIIWGDYASEKGLLTGINSGLLLHSKAHLTGSYKNQRTILTEVGDQLAGQRDGFNTRPGVQYVNYGRRPYGPYYLRGFGNVPTPLEDSDNIGEGTFWCTVPANKTMSTTLVWNPDKEPRTITIAVNGKEISQRILPGKTTNVDCPVNSSTISMTFKGDRRLVVLETVFR